MNILLTTYQGYIEGSTNSIAFLARALAERGHSVYVGAGDKSYLFSLLSNEPSVKLIPMTFRGKLDLEGMRQIRDAVISYDIDIVNAQASLDRYTTILARWFYKLDVGLVHTRRQYPLSTSGPLQRAFYTMGTDRVVVISDELRRIFERKKYPSKHLHVIYNGTPKSRYPSIDPSEVGALRKKLQIEESEKIIGCISRRKKQEQLLAAMKKLGDQYTLLFAGIIPGSLDEIAKRIGIKNRIIYAGMVDSKEIFPYYKLCDVNVLASTSDGFGLVLVESMAMGTPVVGTRSGGILNVIDHEENGLLFDDNDIDGLSDCILRMLNDAQLRENCIRNGYRTAFERFSIEKTAENYERLFESIIKRRNKA